MVVFHASEPFKESVEIMSSIPGLDVLSSLYILGEIGDDMSSFATCKCQCQNVFFLESQNVQLIEFNVQKNLILIIHLCF